MRASSTRQTLRPRTQRWWTQRASMQPGSTPLKATPCVALKVLVLPEEDRAASLTLALEVAVPVALALVSVTVMLTS